MKDLVRSISKNEWYFAALMSLAVILATSLPYLYAYLTAPSGLVYNGLHALSPGDVPVYYSYIDQAKSGIFLVKNLFTSEPQTIGTFNVWWTLVGLLAKIFNLSPILAFQLSRILMIPIFVFVAYIFISYFFTEAGKRKLCLFFLLFSSGLGFYLAGNSSLNNFRSEAIYWWPIDLWLTEANTFNTLYQTSHFIASITLMILIFLLMILAFAKNKFSYAVISGFLALFYFNFHPYYLPVIFGVLGLYLFILMLQANKFLWQKAGYLITIFIISSPSIIYHIWLIQNSEVIAQRALQNVTLISPLFFVFMGYGFLWLGFLAGLFFLFKNKKLDNRFLFLLIWFLVNVVLIYSPFPFHSRYTQGLHIILVIFTLVEIFELFDYLKIKIKPKTFDFWVNNPFLLGMIFLVLFLPSTLFSISRDVYYFTYQPSLVKDRFYLAKDFLKAADWLRNAPRPGTVLGAELSSRFLPGFSGRTVYLAHDHETLFFDAKLIQVIWFYKDNQASEAKKKFLRDKGIDYIIYGDYEKELGSFDPAQKDYLKLVFTSSKIQVYEAVIN